MKASGQEVSTSDRSQSPTDDSMTPKKRYQRNSDTRVAVLNAWGIILPSKTSWKPSLLWVILLMNWASCCWFRCQLILGRFVSTKESHWWPVTLWCWRGHNPATNKACKKIIKNGSSYRCCPCFLAQDPSWVGCGRAASVLWVGVFDGFCCQTWNQSLRFFAVCIAKMHVCHPLISITWFLNTTPASFAPNRLIFYLWSTL